MQSIRLLGSSLRQSLRIMSRNKVGFAGFIVTILVFLLAIFGPYIVKLDMTAHVDLQNMAPTAAHWLGTDYQGRDIFMQIMNGGREVVWVAVIAAVLTLGIGVTLGALAAIVGGWTETLINAAAELVLTIPQFPLLLVLAGFLRLNSVSALGLILAIVSWGTLMRTIRAQVLSLKERDYVQAARSLGLPISHLLFREIMPNMMSYILVQFVMSMTSAIYAQVGLIFLGIVPLSSTNWGVMLSLAWRQGAIYNPNARWYLMMPIFMVVLLQVSLISMTRSLDELFNPRLRVGE